MLNSIRKHDYLFIFLDSFLTVTVLGFITPDYNHFVHTISMLGFGKYRLFLNLNLLVISLYTIFKFFQLRSLNSIPSISIIRRALLVTTVATTLILFFPTNPHNPNILILKELTLTARIHYLTIISFFFLANFGIYHLHKTFSQDNHFHPLVKTTLNLGIICVLLTIVWFISNLFGLLSGYLGIMEKIIIFILFVWFSLVLRQTNSLLFSPKT